MHLRASKAIILCLSMLAIASCTTYSAKEYDPSKHRYPPSRYMPPPVWVPTYPQDMDNYYIYGNGQNYPSYSHGADNPVIYGTPSPSNSPSYNYPLYYQ